MKRMRRVAVLSLLSVALLACKTDEVESLPQGGLRVESARVEPSSGGRDMAMTVHVLGKYTNWEAAGPALDLDFGPGISVDSVLVEDSGLITAHIAVSSEAELGRRDVFLSSESGLLTIKDGFLVQTGGVVIYPARASLGGELWMEIYGTNTNFEPGTTYASVGAEGAGIEVLDIQVRDEERMRLRVRVGMQASTGLHDVYIYNGPVVWIAENAFRIDRGGIRIILNPPIGHQGELVDFTIDAIGTHFDPSTTSILLDQQECMPTTCQIRFPRVNVLNAERIEGTMAISNAARLGLRDLVVSTGEEILRQVDGFDVLPGERNCREDARASAYYGVSRNYRSDGSLRENVSASVVFSIPSDPPCIPQVEGGGGVAPFDGPGSFDRPSVEGRCPPSPTCDAGPFVYLYNDEQTVSLARRYDPIYGRFWYNPAGVLSMEDFQFDSWYHLRAEGTTTPDGIPPFEVQFVLRTIRSDFEILEPDLSLGDQIVSQADGMPVRWTIANTYADGRLSLYQTTAPQDGVGRGRYLVVVPWDDGDWFWEPVWLEQISTGNMFVSLTSSRSGFMWELPYQDEPLRSFGSSSLRWYGYVDLVE